MKRNNFALILALSFALVLSCGKAEVINPETETNPENEWVKICIGGTLDDELTKTEYDENGKMTWLYTDKVALIVYKGDNYSNQNRNQYFLEVAQEDITNNGRHALFYWMIDYHKKDVAQEWLSSGYAVYPVSFSQINSSNYYEEPYIKVPSTIDGLSSSILLIGTPDSETAGEVTDFLFKTAMSVLKVNITNIPASATSIRLTTSDNSYPVDGDFTLEKTDGLVTIGLNNYQGYGNGYQAIDISSEGAIDSRDFYFNIPVGTYPANTLSIEVIDANDGNHVLMKRTIAKPMTLSRNECVTIPTLLYHRVYVNGSPSHPGLYTVKPSGATTIRVNISSEKLTAANYNKDSWKDGNKFGSDQNGWDLSNLTNKSSIAYLSAQGTYYLQYIVSSDGTIPTSLSDDASVMTYGSVPFVYIPSTSKIPVTSSWLNVPYVSTAEGSVANLADGNDGTYWHSPYGSEDPARNATYGQIISVDLNEGGLTTDGNFYCSFATRNVKNNQPKELDIYVSNVRWDQEGFDVNKVKVGTTSNALEGIVPYFDKWIKTPIECSGTGNNYRYITVSILKCANINGSENDLRTSSCTHMAEIEFYTK